MTATLHPVLWIVFWIFAPGFTLCALALIVYAVFGPPTGVELEEKRQQSFLDRMDAAAKEKPRMFVLDEHPLPSKEERERLARALGNLPSELTGMGGPVMIDELGRQLSPPASAVRLAHQGGQEPIRKDGSPDAGEKCPVCKGQGMVELEDYDRTCTTCGGLGTIDETLGGGHFSDPQAPCPDCKP